MTRIINPGEWFSAGPLYIQDSFSSPKNNLNSFTTIYCSILFLFLNSSTTLVLLKTKQIKILYENTPVAYELVF